MYFFYISSASTHLSFEVESDEACSFFTERRGIFYLRELWYIWSSHFEKIKIKYFLDKLFHKKSILESIFFFELFEFFICLFLKLHMYISERIEICEVIVFCIEQFRNTLKKGNTCIDKWKYKEKWYKFCISTFKACKKEKYKSRSKKCSDKACIDSKQEISIIWEYFLDERSSERKHQCVDKGDYHKHIITYCSSDDVHWGKKYVDKYSIKGDMAIYQTIWPVFFRIGKL